LYRVRVTYTFDIPGARNASEAYEAGRRQVPPVANSAEVHCWNPGEIASLKQRIADLEAVLGKAEQQRAEGLRTIPAELTEAAKKGGEHAEASAS
jgi:hypothetical protein